eukprot:snap_masked-scaffold_7-processed-gene-7.7-mRNA-1 protein AED:1.00 eAED:1.00 QI:0/0/0/0/1/1/2/0/339
MYKNKKQEKKLKKHWIVKPNDLGENNSISIFQSREAESLRQLEEELIYSAKRNCVGLRLWNLRKAFCEDERKILAERINWPQISRVEIFDAFMQDRLLERALNFLGENLVNLSEFSFLLKIFSENKHIFPAILGLLFQLKNLKKLNIHNIDTSKDRKGLTNLFKKFTHSFEILSLDATESFSFAAKYFSQNIPQCTHTLELSILDLGILEPNAMFLGLAQSDLRITLKKLKLIHKGCESMTENYIYSIVKFLCTLIFIEDMQLQFDFGGHQSTSYLYDYLLSMEKKLRPGSRISFVCDGQFAGENFQSWNSMMSNRTRVLSRESSLFLRQLSPSRIVVY